MKRKATDREKERRRKREERRRNSFLPLAIGMSGGVLIASTAFFFFAKQAESVVAGRAQELDEELMTLVHRANGAVTTRSMQLITQFGSHAVIGAASAIAAWQLTRKGKTRDAWTVVLNTAGAMALNTSLKAVFQRQRPQERARHIRLPRSHSFPSGHSLLSAATYPIVMHHLVQSRSTSVLLAGQAVAGALIVSVGFSRVYFGVHFPSDVFGGFAAGLGWLGLTSLTHTMIERNLMSRPGNDRRSSPRRRALKTE